MVDTLVGLIVSVQTKLPSGLFSITLEGCDIGIHVPKTSRRILLSLDRVPQAVTNMLNMTNWSVSIISSLMRDRPMMVDRA
jgi:hypothetical protein